MNINELPDDCLLYIFNLFYEFKTLLNCSRVCQRWKQLVFERLHNVKYLTDADKNGYPAGTIYYRNEDRLERFEISKWFPKLKILDKRGHLRLDALSDLPVKGLLTSCGYGGVTDYMTLDIPFIEMIAASDFYDYFANDVQGPMLKQLFISDSNVSKFASYAKYFPNLRRLHIQDFPLYPFEDKLYTGPVLEKLEILEICFHAQAEELDHYYGFSLADHCPTLKSAFHFIQTGEQFFINTGIKNHFLEDLVIEFDKGQDWSVIRRILSKYPNLKHLAIRRGKSISDEIIPELLGLLPCIILIDIRNSRIITEKSTAYIDWYCRQHNRSISFYYKDRPKISKKWPHLSTKRVYIGQGFDFMKFCFLSRFNELPPLLDPEE